MDWDYPEYNIVKVDIVKVNTVKVDKNTEKSFGDLNRLGIIQWRTINSVKEKKR